MATHPDVDVVINLRSLLGEGPIWDHRTEQLAWVDILAGFVHSTDVADGTTTTLSIGPPVGAIALVGETDRLLAVRDGFAKLSDGVLGQVEAVAGPGMRMNDGAVDPAGRFVVGSMALDSAPNAGAMYSRSPEGKTAVLMKGLTISNGIGWSIDGSTMYYIDSAEQRVDILDYDVSTGFVSNRRPLVTIDPDEGTPDGLTVDAEGCVWVALWGGGQVRRFAPDGTLIDTLHFPVRRTSACAFGGPDLDRLFVTSAAAGATSGTSNPLDGALFVVDPGCRGLPTPTVAA